MPSLRPPPLLAAAAYANGCYGTNYAHQQVPTSVPQSAAYGTYPQTYSAQKEGVKWLLQPTILGNFLKIDSTTKALNVLCSRTTHSKINCQYTSNSNA
ncbi:uncharacterized protein LOC111365324 isoform X2 [Olea europaea var. sylvestris]|uniref:uncharacterized protein LOC111365324 isoform X2 n=1 Tax=Olea europaea var. sylvestris TaxID=158386 RepID=UPI000C1D8507|nr:uncharacterized protein LOC111365324 isoform X2 [Olea europaea var. sylvestris]